MTIEEKRNYVKHYCESRNCDRCALKKAWTYSASTDCLFIGSASEEELDWALRIIRGAKTNAAEETAEETAEAVNHPAHYQGKHECIDEMIALFGVEAVKHFCMCNVYKYRFRAANKNGQEDLDKADWYMDKLMELEGEEHE